MARREGYHVLEVGDLRLWEDLVGRACVLFFFLLCLRCIYVSSLCREKTDGGYETSVTPEGRNRKKKKKKRGPSGLKNFWEEGEMVLSSFFLTIECSLTYLGQAEAAGIIRDDGDPQVVSEVLGPVLQAHELSRCKRRCQDQRRKLVRLAVRGRRERRRVQPPREVVAIRSSDLNRRVHHIELLFFSLLWLRDTGKEGQQAQGGPAQCCEQVVCSDRAIDLSCYGGLEWVGKSFPL